MGTAPQMTLEALQQTPEFRRLSPKMALWVSTYVANFIKGGSLDPLFATRSSYDCSSDKSSRAFGYEILENKKVQAVLKVYFNFGRTEREIDLEQIEEALTKAEPGSVAHQRLLSIRTTIKTAPNYSSLPEPEPEPKPESEPESKAAPVATRLVQDPRIPVGALPLRDKAGAIRGYQTAEGMKVRFADVEVTK